MANNTPNRAGAATAVPDLGPTASAVEEFVADASEFGLDADFGVEESLPAYDGTKTKVKLAYPVRHGDEKGHRLLGYGDEIVLRAKQDPQTKRFVSGPDMVNANQLLDGGCIMGSAQAIDRAQRDAAVAAKRGVSKEKLPELLPIRTAAQLRARTVTHGLEGSTEDKLRREHGETSNAIKELADVLGGVLQQVGANAPGTAKAPDGRGIHPQE